MHEQFARNIHKAQRAEYAKEQVPESRDSPWVVGSAHVPSLLQGLSVKGLAVDTAKAAKMFAHNENRKQTCSP
jgi:hypothetical protein